MKLLGIISVGFDVTDQLLIRIYIYIILSLRFTDLETQKCNFKIILQFLFLLARNYPFTFHKALRTKFWIFFFSFPKRVTSILYWKYTIPTVTQIRWSFTSWPNHKMRYKKYAVYWIVLWGDSVVTWSSSYTQGSISVAGLDTDTTP
jgi:hypothetical protein